MGGSEKGAGSALPPDFETHWIDHSNAHWLDAVAEGVFDHAIDPDRLKAYLTNSLNWMCVALHDDVVVGMCMSVIHLHPDKPTELFLDEIGTGDDWRRQGIARRLMQMVFDRCDAEEIDEIWLGTEPDNLPARGLYESTGAKGEAALIYYLEW
ncbi:MAG: GNAT family N-acetyltransferase [Pseudomonadota bacterium]